MVSMMKIKPMSILLIKIDFRHLCHLINLCYKSYVSQWENHSLILPVLTTVNKAGRYLRVYMFHEKLLSNTFNLYL